MRKLLLITLLAASGLGPLPAAEPIQPPKLVVAILVDQLRYDYLERYRDQFTPGGFKLLTEKGAFMTRAHYNYMPTLTGPGHASFLSGAPPSVHGIISNDWFDKTTKKTLNCVADPSVNGVGSDSPAAKRSPRNFQGGSTFADEMRLRYHSKVVGVSHKDRGAILPAGKKPAGAYWFDSVTGTFITSTYYMPELPGWVKAFNDRKLPASYVGQKWERLLDPSNYEWPDEAVGEGVLVGEPKAVFPHTIAASPTEGFETIIPTPFGNTLLTEFALAALEGEKLGQGPQPDLLTVSYSCVDAAGHKFGPNSQELQDMILRMDRELETLFKALDAKIGLANVAMMLTADHGVAPNPEFSIAQGLDGERVDLVAPMQDLLAQLSARFGPGQYLLAPRITDGNIYFNHEFLRDRQISAEEVAVFIREWALGTGKYQMAFTRQQLLDGRAQGLLGERVVNGYHAERSGDVVLVMKPFKIPSAGSTGTTHGSPYTYDTHIPVMFYGAGFKPGRYADDFYITDIAAMLCAALNMNEPAGSIGKPLVKALAGYAP